MVECRQTFYQRRFAAGQRPDKFLCESCGSCGAWHVEDMTECRQTFYLYGGKNELEKGIRART